jgi:phage tail protein X
MITVHTTVQDEMLDAIVFQHYGYVDVAVETVMAFNPHIHELRERLPPGVKISLPEIEQPNTSRMQRLWDT